MKILGDSQIVLFHELFGTLGETEVYHGREISDAQLAGADALITRSTVIVNEHLLADTNVSFVGTCTIGIDHYDTHYLNQQNITWTNAAGCNARAVVQYVLSAMAQLSPSWLNSTVGIIGCGNIGGQVYRCLRALGVTCRVYDPLLDPLLPLDELTSEQRDDMVSLEQVFQCDIVTCHAPLTHDGDHPSYHLLGENELQQLRPNTLLISAGRGAVIDNQALLRLLSLKKQTNKQIHVALDVWEDEPKILPELVPLVEIATPHIAGHSLEGKENGTVMVYQALCEFLRSHPQFSSESISPIDAESVVNKQTIEVDLATVVSPSDYIDDATTLNQLLLMMYPIMEDDRRFRDGSGAHHALAEHFDYLRKNYPVRREYSHFMLSEASKTHPAYAFIASTLDILVSC